MEAQHTLQALFDWLQLLVMFLGLLFGAGAAIAVVRWWSGR